MLSISEIKTGKIIQVSGEPFAVAKAEHHKMGRSGAVLKVKLKNLITGNMLDKTFQGNEKAEEAQTEKKKSNYLYRDGSSAFFMDNETFEQFELAAEMIGEKLKFLKEGTDVDTLYFENRPVAIDLPIKVSLRVASAPPGVKGNSAGSVTKKIILETGAEISAPLFIKDGDIIVVNTDSGEYVERA